MILQEFKELCLKKPNGKAFIFVKKKHAIVKRYLDVFEDVKKGITFLKTRKIVNRKVLFLIKPSYDFYILLISNLALGNEIIFIDSLKKDKLPQMIKEAEPDLAIVRSQSTLMKILFKPFRTLQFIKINNYQNSQMQEKFLPSEKAILTTFTSGTTGEPKKIQRTLNDLTKQFYLLAQTMNVRNSKVVLTMLPIYVLANLLFGVTTFLESFKKRNFQNVEDYLLKQNVDTINASVSKYLLFTKPLENIKYCYTGGSIISLSDAIQIKSTFPNADFVYVYGASEAVLIAKTNLDSYIEELKNDCLCLGEVVSGVIVEIVNPDNNGIGEIAVKGEIVLNKYHCTGDLGYIDQGKLYLVGRKKFSLQKFSLFNYQIEIMILKKYQEISKVAFIPHDESLFLIIEFKNRRSKPIAELDEKYHTIYVRKLPLDMRHNYKIDYFQVEKILKTRNKN